jgi:predicted Zn-dependent peptidase
VKNGIEAMFLSQMETIEAKADQLNQYYTFTGNPNYFAQDLGRYRALQPADVQAAVREWLPSDRRFELSIVPAKQ